MDALGVRASAILIVGSTSFEGHSNCGSTHPSSRLTISFQTNCGCSPLVYALCTISISLVVAARDETTPDCRSRPAACPPEHPLENTLGCIPSRARSLPSLFCHLMVQTLISSNRERRQTTTSQQSRPAAALNMMKVCIRRYRLSHRKCDHQKKV